jgi:hypothetical protein
MERFVVNGIQPVQSFEVVERLIVKAEVLPLPNKLL